MVFWMKGREDRRTRLRGRRRRPRERIVPAVAECVENRLLLSGGQISGQVYEDPRGGGISQPLPGWQVYIDANQNGVYDPGELTTVTDPAGDYSFADLPAGSYVVRDGIPSGWFATTPSSATHSITLADGQVVAGQDFGNAQLGSISGTIYDDVNGNAVRDPGEAPLAGFQIYVDLNNNGTPDPGEPIATTDADGHYAFNNLQLGQITLRPVAVSGWQPSFPAAVSDDLISGVSPTQDWGFTQLSVVNGQVSVAETNSSPAAADWTVYADLNGNGVLDPGEPSTTTQDESGFPGFYHLGLQAGSGYQIRLELPTGYQLTRPLSDYSIDLAPLSQVYNINFSAQPGGLPGSISGTVYDDVLGNGTNSGSDSGLSGWRVYLDLNQNGQYDSGEPTAVTDTSGQYTIADVPPDQYVLREVIPSGWFASAPPDGGWRYVTVGSAQAASGADFGNFLYGTLSGTVFNDVNGDGVQQSSEPGLAGWEVYLDTNNNGLLDYGELAAVTDASGSYTISGIGPGTYNLRIIRQSGWVTPSGGLSAQISSGSNLTFDWALSQPSSGGTISGTIFNDMNVNGALDPGEPGLAGFQMYLDLNNDGVFDSGDLVATSDSTGHYAFTGLAQGTYQLQPVPRAGWQDVNLARAGFTFSAPGQSYVQNWALTSQAMIIGRVYKDANGDGLFDNGDVQLPGVTMYVDLNNDGVLDNGEPSTVTDALGLFRFGLPAGNYTVREIIPQGYHPIAPSGGVTTATAALPALGGLEFGNAPNTLNTAAISGTLFNDFNGMGKNPGNSFEDLSGWRVYIDSNNNGQYDAGEPIAITDALGQYSFGGLAAGSYTVREVVQPGWYPTVPNSGARVVTVSTGQTLSSQDFGNAQYGSISGTIYNDANGNGLRDPGESPLAGYQLFIDQTGNGVLDPGEPVATSDASGHYAFNNLKTGQANVRIVAVNGWQPSFPAGAGFAIGSGVNYTQNWGFTQLSIVNGQVYLDENGDGTNNGSDQNASGWTVYADLNGNGTLDPGEPSTTTEGQVGFPGSYHLGLPGGASYTIRLVLPNGYQLTQPQGSYSAYLGPLSQIYSFDFGAHPAGSPGSISGTLYNDIDGKGTDLGPPFILSGWRVYLDTNNNSQYDIGEPTAITDASGKYTIANVPPNQYILREVVPTGWFGSAPSAGGWRFVTVGSSQAVTGADLGSYRYGTLSGTVFNDLNADGVHQPSEPGLAGWELYLDLNNNGVLDPGEPTATTDAIGRYTFTDLQPGNYNLRIVEKDGWVTLNGGLNFQVTSGSSFTFDWGQLQGAVVTGSVFNDSNNNGVRDKGESGLAGVKVFLDLNNNSVLDPGEPVATTDSNGNYVLVVPQNGTYTVRQVVPSGYAATEPLGYSGSTAFTVGQDDVGPVFGDVLISSVPMNFGYLVLLARHYGQGGTFASGDLNGDGKVDFSDLVLLARNYGHALSVVAATAADLPAFAGPTAVTAISANPVTDGGASAGGLTDPLAALINETRSSLHRRRLNRLMRWTKRTN